MSDQHPDVAHTLPLSAIAHHQHVVSSDGKRFLHRDARRGVGGASYADAELEAACAKLTFHFHGIDRSAEMDRGGLRYNPARFRMAKRREFEKRGDFVTSLERGLRVLQTFSREHAQLTLSEVAALTELSPATARRSLHTLETLGYVGRSGRRFLLRPKVLGISSGYLSAINAEMVLQPFLQDLVNEVGGSSSVTILDDLQIVYLAHASANRAIRLTAGVAARYPAYATSMGRVLLAYQPDWVIDAYFSRASLRKLTERTETNPAVLRRILKETRLRGYTAIQDELDYGIVSVALPIFTSDGRIVAAANCADVTTRLNKNEIVQKRLPALRQAVRRIEAMLTQYPELANSVAAQNAAPKDLAHLNGRRRPSTPSTQRSLRGRAPE